jgi:hypothetical protein
MFASIVASLYATPTFPTPCPPASLSGAKIRFERPFVPNTMSVTTKFSGIPVTDLNRSSRACCSGVRSNGGVSTPVQAFTAPAIAGIDSPGGNPGAGRPVAPPGSTPTLPQTAS